MTCDKNPEKIKNMFNEISFYYDRMNNYISLGTHYLIKFMAVRELNIKPRSMVLDLCCGTGDFSRIISKFYPGAHVIGLDFSEKMLKIAKNKNPKNVFMIGDCTNLPFEPNEFDYITAGFGLRNIQDRQKAISEAYRVLDCGGKFLHLDFGYNRGISKIFDILVLAAAKILRVNHKHYQYLLNSRNEFPPPDDLIKEFESAGFKFVKRKDYLLGAISMQIMQK